MTIDDNFDDLDQHSDVSDQVKEREIRYFQIKGNFRPFLLSNGIHVRRTFLDSLQYFSLFNCYFFTKFLHTQVAPNKY